MAALNTNLGVNFPRGFRSTGVYCGIKKPGLLDLALIVSETESSVAGMFTTNRACAAPVVWSKQVVAGGRARAIVANSGNANCLTGEQGMRDAQRMAVLVAKRLECHPTQVVVASTGVIGVPLPMPAVESGIAQAFERLHRLACQSHVRRVVRQRNHHIVRAGVAVYRDAVEGRVHHPREACLQVSGVNRQIGRAHV